MFGKNEIITLILAASPVLELRGAIPFAIANHLPLSKAYFLSIIGNLLPVIPLFLFFKYIFKKLRSVKFIGDFLNWWFKRVEKKSKFVSTYGFLGLVLFVSIPFPTTGAWTGTLVANLLKFSFLKTFLGVFIGVLIAGILVSLATQGVLRLWFIFI
jgi:uncharacterized membrane protein